MSPSSAVEMYPLQSHIASMLTLLLTDSMSVLFIEDSEHIK